LSVPLQALRVNRQPVALDQHGTSLTIPGTAEGAAGRKGGHADLARGSARSLLLTVLGELVWPANTPAKTSSLLYVMNGLGFEEATARQAIIRGADSGWIEPHRHGREVSWTLTPQLLETFEVGSQRVFSLSNPFEDWDNRWLVLLVTVPHALRSSRKRLYSDLNWAGFGNPAAGVWLSPHSERRGQVAAVIERLGLTASTMSFLGPADSVGLSEDEIVRAGWDLDTLAETYAAVYEQYRDPKPHAGDDLLFTDIKVMSELQRFPFFDPQLPEALLPNWIGRMVTAHIQELRTGWADALHARWAEINA
jgi:phenylacetic acid degradation operon negative regulatory protein